MSKKNMNEVKNETNNNEEKQMSMFDLMKMIDHNTKKIARLSMKMDKLTNLNEELKGKLKSMIENI